MQIAICDDELQQRFIVKSLLKRSPHYLPTFDVVEFASGEELIQSVTKADKRYNIIFLDVAMGGINGIDTARRIRTCCSDSIIIFVTGLMDYVLQAFEVKAFRYLIKPVPQLKFDKEFKSALSEFARGKDKQYVIETAECVVNLSIDDVLYVESDLRKINVYTHKKVYTFYGKIEEQAELLNKQGFIIIHRGILANLSHIKFIDKTTIHLKSGVELPLSRNRRKEVYDAFTHFLLESSIS